MSKINIWRNRKFVWPGRGGVIYIRKQKEMKIIFLIISFFLIVTIIFEFISMQIMPMVITLADAKAKAMATKISSDIVNKKLEGLNYKNFVFIQKDSESRVTALQANIIVMNRLSTELASQIQNRMETLEKFTINVPVANVLDNAFFSNRGPSVDIEIVPYGNVDVDFKTEFISAGINQTRHVIYLEIRNKLIISAPFVKKGTEVVTKIPVAETIIVGDVPQSLTNVQPKNWVH